MTILLTAYDAKRCARRVHNDFDAELTQPQREVPATAKVRFDAMDQFRESVIAELKAALGAGRWADLRDRRDRRSRIDATLIAMDTGVEVIIGGSLPDDVEGGRKGHPDVLLRTDGGYVPGEIKWHQVLTRRARGAAGVSRLGEPTSVSQVAGWAVKTSTRLGDHLQLAHDWRMLQACGRAPQGPARGAILGTDVLEDAHVFSWLDLEKHQFSTYSRSRGTARRSALERHDHEHGFRVRVATTSAAGEPALVAPIFIDECDNCPWLEHCRQVVGENDASAAFTTGRLSVREWHALSRAGVSTLAELASLDTTSSTFREAYLPEVTHLRDALTRVDVAVRRARMVRDDVVVEREIEESIELPDPGVEIDLDAEWDPDDRVYLWGALLTVPGEPAAYHHFASFDPLDDEGAKVLAVSLVNWLREQIAIAEERGESVSIYHYSAAEPSRLKRLLGQEEVADVVERFVDLYATVKKHFFGRDGLGIKQVAPAFGFDWDDADRGGLQSQVWLIDARTGESADVRTANINRILRYNRDDVRATAALRGWLRTQD